MSLYVVAPVVVAIWTKFWQALPWHRSILYWVTPTLSVAAVHDRLTWLDEGAVAVRLVGAVGACVSVPVVVAVAMFEYPLRFAAASAARTR